MGRFTKSSRFFGGKKLYLSIFALYFIGAFTFVTIGLQPVNSPEAVYASESESATSTLEIPSIKLSAPVKPTSIRGADIVVPEQIAGSFLMHHNKTLIIGHSSTIFRDLKLLEVGDIFSYDNSEYKITTIEEKAKSDIDMSKILQPEAEPTIILMTCSGEAIPNTDGDHTHRLIIVAKKV